MLGTGANGGLPQIDCDCENCLEASERKELSRLRSSVLVESGGEKLVLDCGPDFRQQMLRSGLRLPDLGLVVVTHLHFDHAGGLMELSAGKALRVPVLVNESNRKLLRERGDIQFLEGAGFVCFPDEDEAWERWGVRLVDVPHDPRFPTSGVVVQGNMKSLWYSPDVGEITEEMLKEIAMIDVVVFDGTFLNENTYPASKFNHLTIEKSVDILKREVIYTHVNHSENVKEIEKFLRAKGCLLASDGMVVTLR
jgi:phosphoribosyl 1,2-cyclic phosphate phosphodiesterase